MILSQTDELLDAMSELRLLFPDWRMGQLIANLTMAAGGTDAGAIWDVEDEQLLMAARRLDAGPCQLFLKLENQNPGGSIKDRVGLYLIQAAERAGTLEPGGTLIEATAGNTGLGLALVAAQKGYRLLLVIPDKMSQEKIFHLKAMGADVVMTRSVCSCKKINALS